MNAKYYLLGTDVKRCHQCQQDNSIQQDKEVDL